MLLTVMVVADEQFGDDESGSKIDTEKHPCVNSNTFLPRNFATSFLDLSGLIGCGNIHSKMHLSRHTTRRTRTNSRSCKLQLYTSNPLHS
jgi:hypothetical protein